MSVKSLLGYQLLPKSGNRMSDEEVGKKGKKDKGDYAEVEFEIGNIEFEAKGRSIVVERMFRLLLEKIEEGKLVATLRLQDEDEEEEEEEESLFDSSEEEAVLEDDEELSEDDETKESIRESLEETLREINDAVPDRESTKEESYDDRTIPSEAYLDPPPAWDSLDDGSPPESTAERESSDESP